LGLRRRWKNFRINLMYWRFRHITRNRLRLQTWYRSRRRQPVPSYRPRGSAISVYRHSARRTWIILIALVAILTALRVLSWHVTIGSSLVFTLDALAVVLAVYLAIRAAL
jgi:hypothetical protein